MPSDSHWYIPRLFRLGIRWSFSEIIMYLVVSAKSSSLLPLWYHFILFRMQDIWSHSHSSILLPLSVAKSISFLLIVTVMALAKSEREVSRKYGKVDRGTLHGSLGRNKEQFYPHGQSHKAYGNGEKLGEKVVGKMTSKRPRSTVYSNSGGLSLKTALNLPHGTLMRMRDKQ